jgi:hypothetical protein
MYVVDVRNKTRKTIQSLGCTTIMFESLLIYIGSTGYPDNPILLPHCFELSYTNVVIVAIVISGQRRTTNHNQTQLEMSVSVV